MSIEAMVSLLNYELTPDERDELKEIEDKIEANNISCISDFSYVDSNEEVDNVNNFSF
jgi:hypothetical protein